MMRSPALAMAWELWGKNRAGILAAFGVIVAGLLPCSTLGPVAVNDYVVPLSVVVFFSSLPLSHRDFHVLRNSKLGKQLAACRCENSHFR